MVNIIEIIKQEFSKCLTHFSKTKLMILLVFVETDEK